MARQLTAANSIILLSIAGVFNTPQQLQGYAADDILDTDAINSSELVMGVDGILSAGFVFQQVKQTFTLQANSDSVLIFDDWYAAEFSAIDKFAATGTLILPSLGQKWVMTNGFLSSYKPAPDVKKIVQPRKFEITWQSISPAGV